MEDDWDGEEDELEEVHVPIPRDVAKALFELKSKISRAEPIPERRVGQQIIPAASLEEVRRRRAWQPVNFQPFALACVLKKMQQRYPLPGGQWKWTSGSGWMWNTSLFADPVFSVFYAKPDEGPFSTLSLDESSAILVDTNHPRRGELEDHIYDNLVLSTTPGLYPQVDALGGTAEAHLAILTECAADKENPIKQKVKRTATEKTVEQVLTAPRNESSSPVQMFRASAPASLPSIRESGTLPPEIKRNIADFLTEKGPVLKKKAGRKTKKSKKQRRRTARKSR